VLDARFSDDRSGNGVVIDLSQMKAVTVDPNGAQLRFKLEQRLAKLGEGGHRNHRLTATTQEQSQR